MQLCYGKRNSERAEIERERWRGQEGDPISPIYDDIVFVTSSCEMIVLYSKKGLKQYSGNRKYLKEFHVPGTLKNFIECHWI